MKRGGSHDRRAAAGKAGASERTRPQKRISSMQPLGLLGVAPLGAACQAC